MPAIDDILPRFDVHEVHSVALLLPPDDAIAFALATPVAGDPIVRTLFRLRGLKGEGSIAEALTAIGLRELARADGGDRVRRGGAPRAAQPFCWRARSPDRWSTRPRLTRSRTAILPTLGCW